MLTNATHTDKSDDIIQAMHRLDSKGRFSLRRCLASKCPLCISSSFCFSRQFTSVVCYPSCRWGWSSWCNFCSGRPCWELAGPWYRPKIAPRWPGYHPLSQCPLSQWLLGKNAHIVAETELQCMYRSCILDSEFLFCPGHNFPWQELSTSFAR